MPIGGHALLLVQPLPALLRAGDDPLYAPQGPSPTNAQSFARRSKPMLPIRLTLRRRNLARATVLFLGQPVRTLSATVSGWGISGSAKVAEA
jgi:hypothetical protein